MIKYNTQNMQLFADDKKKIKNPINQKDIKDFQSETNKKEDDKKQDDIDPSKENTKDENMKNNKKNIDSTKVKKSLEEYSEEGQQINEDSDYSSKESPEVMSLKFRIRELEEENNKLTKEKSEIEKGYIFKENIIKLREKYEDFKSLENSILKKIDTEVINIDGEKVKYLYESGYDGLIAAYNMCKYSVEELPDIKDYIEKNIDKIAQNETVKNVVIENYLKDLDEMKMPLVFKDEDGYTSYTKKEEPKNFADAAKLFLKSLE